jgi:hypothetical protein
VQLITTHFPSRISDPQAMAQRARMILVRASNGVEVDMSLGLPGYEDELFRRAVEIEVDAGRYVRVCAAEDLIIHKAVAGRPLDIVDIESVVLRQAKRLDTVYIRRWLSEFNDVLANSDILERFEQAYRKLKSK